MRIPLTTAWGLALDHYAAEEWTESIKYLELSLRLRRLLTDSIRYCALRWDRGKQKGNDAENPGIARVLARCDHSVLAEEVQATFLWAAATSSPQGDPAGLQQRISAQISAPCAFKGETSRVLKDTIRLNFASINQSMTQMAKCLTGFYSCAVYVGILVLVCLNLFSILSSVVFQRHTSSPDFLLHSVKLTPHIHVPFESSNKTTKSTTNVVSMGIAEAPSVDLWHQDHRSSTTSIKSSKTRGTDDWGLNCLTLRNSYKLKEKMTLKGWHVFAPFSHI